MIMDDIDYCASCNHYDCEPHLEPCVSCRRPYIGEPTKFKAKPQTNADRIRAMSDAELAQFLAERSVNESTVQLLDKDNDLTAVQIEAIRHRIYCALIQWLKQPAEE